MKHLPLLSILLLAGCGHSLPQQAASGCGTYADTFEAGETEAMFVKCYLNGWDQPIKTAADADGVAHTYRDVRKISRSIYTKNGVITGWSD